MMKTTAGAAVAVALTGCGTTAASSTTATPQNPSDRQMYTNAVGFQTAYERLHHVNLATAQCVWPLTKAAGGSFPTTQVMAMNPRNTPLGNCEQ